MSEKATYSASDIVVLEGLEAVRRRPGMYVGSRGPAGIEHLLHELVGNGIDQQLRGKATMTGIRRDGVAWEVWDDGPGFPVDRPAGSDELADGERYVSQLFGSGRWKNHERHVHLWRADGVGLPAVNALASELTLRTWREGACWEGAWSRGQAVGRPRRVADRPGRGTVWRFTPDPEIFGDARPLLERVRGVLWEAVHLLPNVRLLVGDEHFGPSDLTALAWADATEESFVRDAPKVRAFRGERAGMRYDVVVCGERDGEPTVRSWANGVRTAEGGSHVEGVLRALDALEVHADRVYVSVMGTNVMYAGPTRGRLNTPEWADALCDVLQAAW